MRATRTPGGSHATGTICREAKLNISTVACGFAEGSMMKIPVLGDVKVVAPGPADDLDFLASLGGNCPDALLWRRLRVVNVTAIRRDDRLVAAPTRHRLRSAAGRWNLPDLPVSRSLAIGSKVDPLAIERPTRPNVVEPVGSQRFDGAAVGGHDIEIPVARGRPCRVERDPLAVGTPARASHAPAVEVRQLCLAGIRRGSTPRAHCCPDLRETNAIRVPSGENRMSKSRDVDSMTRKVASPEGWRFGEDGVGSSQMSPAMSEF